MIVMASKAIVPFLTPHISASNYVVKPVTLEERLHTSENKEALACLLDLCDAHPNL